MQYKINDAASAYPRGGGGVDCHVHIFDPARGFPEPRFPHPDYAATLENVSSLAEEFGIDRFVLTQPSFLGFDNTLILNEVLRQPHQLRAVVWLSEETEPLSLDDLARNGVVGLRFPLKYSRSIPDWTAYYDIFREAKRHDIHVELGLEGQELVKATHIALDLGLTVVIAHLGMFDTGVGPDKDDNFQALLDAASSRRVWVKLSAPYRAPADFSNRACARLLDTLGPDRCVWGSDWPHVGPGLDRLTTYAMAMNWFRRCVPDEDIRHQILSVSPAELYQFHD